MRLSFTLTVDQYQNTLLALAVAREHYRLLAKQSIESDEPVGLVLVASQIDLWLGIDGEMRKQVRGGAR